MTKQQEAKKQEAVVNKAEEAKANAVSKAEQKAVEKAPDRETKASVEEEIKPFLGKYSKATAAVGGHDRIPDNFKYANTPLKVNPAGAPKKDTSVMGRIYKMVGDNPGITGRELVRKMQETREWAETGAKAKYAKNGVVCALWVIGYINGALRPSLGHLQVMDEKEAEKVRNKKAA